jgi:hypothetical protein
VENPGHSSNRLTRSGEKFKGQESGVQSQGVQSQRVRSPESGVRESGVQNSKFKEPISKIEFSVKTPPAPLGKGERRVFWIVSGKKLQDKEVNNESWSALLRKRKV